MPTARIAISGCIYCGTLPFSDEHWLPRSLGKFRGYEFLTDRICRICNEELGRLDEEFIRTGPEGTFRAMLGIAGRHDESTNPAYYRAASTNPTRILPADTGEPGILYEPFHDAGERRGRPLRQLVVEDAAGGRHAVPLNLHWTGDVLRAALASRNLTDSKVVEVYVDPEEIERARELLGPIFPGFSAELFSRDGEVGQKRVRFENTLARPYFRALAKTAFHYALKHVDAWQGTEREFDPIRGFIRDDRGEVDRFVIGTASFSPFVPPRSAPTRWAHFLAVDAHDSGVDGLLQFFVGPDADYRPFFWTVRLASCNVTPVPCSRGHVAAYYSAPQGGFDGELGELRIARSGAPS